MSDWSEHLVIAKKELEKLGNDLMERRWLDARHSAEQVSLHLRHITQASYTAQQNETCPPSSVNRG